MTSTLTAGTPPVPAEPTDDDVRLVVTLVVDAGAAEPDTAIGRDGTWWLTVPAATLDSDDTDDYIETGRMVAALLRGHRRYLDTLDRVVARLDEDTSS